MEFVDFISSIDVIYVHIKIFIIKNAGYILESTKHFFDSMNMFINYKNSY